MRRVHRIAGLLACALALAGSSACDAEAVCGDGVVGRGENEATCCLDTGCAFGACDEGTRRCVEEWTELCRQGAAGCLGDGPYACGADETPRYECAECGCPDDGRCLEGACWSVPEIAEQRDDDEPPANLDLDDYFTLADELARPQLTLAELSDELAAFVRADRRRSVVVVGAAAGSARESSVAATLRSRLRARGLATRETLVADDVAAGALGGAPFDDAELRASCAPLETSAAEALADEGLVAVVARADLAHREPCFFPQHWTTCAPPTATDCALRAGRVAASVLIVDFDALLDELDRTLLRRATNRPQGERMTHLDQTLTRWRQYVDALAAPAEYTASVDGEELVLRGQASARYQGTWWLSLPRPGKVAWGLVGFRLLWSDAPTQAFLVEHDIIGRDCAWALSADESEVAYACEANGARVEATIDAREQDVIAIERELL